MQTSLRVAVGKMKAGMAPEIRHGNRPKRTRLPVSHKHSPDGTAPKRDANQRLSLAYSLKERAWRTPRFGILESEDCRSVKYLQRILSRNTVA